MSVAIKRINMEFNKVNTEGKEHGWTASLPDPDNLFVWHVIITGPPDSVYQGFKYKISVNFPDQFPFKPPTMTFITPIYHANVMLGDEVGKNGTICWNTLKEDWSPALQMTKVLLTLQQLMACPNVLSAYNHDAGVKFTNDINSLKSIVADMAAKYPV